MHETYTNTSYIIQAYDIFYYKQYTYICID